MITQLTIRNFILIQDVTLSFRSGFSVFTGETGAGKSILIDAISILLGDRFLSDAVGRESTRAFLEGQFVVSNDSVIQSLNQAGYPTDHTMTITRECDKEGKSVSKLNGKPVSVSLLKEIGASLIDIHNQHDTQYLLNDKSHLGLLDRFVNEKTALNQLKQAHHAYETLRQDLIQKQKSVLNPDELEFLQFQSHEIELAQLQEGEDVHLEDQQKEMMAYEKIALHLDAALTQLDEQSGVSEKLHQALRELKSISESDRIAMITSQINDLYYELTDKIADLKQIKSLMTFDEHELNAIQERLYTIGKLKKKFGPTITTILAKREEILDRINLINRRDEILAELQQRVDVAYAHYRDLALQMSQLRQQKAQELESLVLRQCHDLYLDKARFKILLSEGSDSSTGFDQAEFLISMNPGELLKPLTKVASGGELSRLMLGLKVIFNDLQGIETVIFDEIDAGVSGRVATSIGQKMHQIAKSSQVFTVTHLGQVAACGDSHYLVSKTQGEQMTLTSITTLDYNQRIHELSQISTGTVSESSLNAAKELLDTLQAAVNAP
jgi:DNA repair protein RecN (Recombination protein N)